MKISDIKLGTNYSRYYGVGNVDDLAASMKLHGLLQPISVTEDGTLVFGYRRYAAAVKLGWEEIPSTLCEAADIAQANLVENLNREQPSLWEEIQSIRDVFGENPTYADVARALSKSHNWVKPRVDVWTLPQAIIDEVRMGRADMKVIKNHLKRAAGPSVSERFLRRPSENDIRFAITELMQHGRDAEARALSYSIGTINRSQLLGD